MQIDFHHGVVYVLARLAGFDHSQATTIAYASQYVDDATNMGTIVFDNGRRYAHIASAHEVFDLYQNCDVKEDCEVWVPFHFLPGNNGAAADRALTVPVIQRLICTPDSYVATDMCHACFGTRGQHNSLHRLGITTHTYADTWAHQGFVGIRHDINSASDVELEEKYNTDKLKNELAAILISGFIKVGHGALQTYPDMPFLRFSYKNSFGTTVSRDNPDQFLVACDRIFELHSYYLGVSNPTLLPADEEVLRDSLTRFDDLDSGVRHASWLTLIKEGRFSFGKLTDEEFAQIQYVAKGSGSWKCDALGTTKAQDASGEVFPYRPSFEESNWKLFHDALKDHHSQILEGILPKYQLPLTPELRKAAGA